jgi:uncharacterized protein
MAPTKFQILAIDGGGYKGMFVATLLARLEADLRIRMTDHFDLVTGTSTGGIIALGLGAGLTPHEISDFYVERGPTIFHRTTRFGRLRRAKYQSFGLETSLAQVLGEKTLGQSKVRLAIPAYDLTNDDVYLFRTPHAEFLRRDHREKMLDVALATSAAPTYLPARRLRGLRLIDGGVWANNPVLVGIAEAVRTFGHSLSDISVLSLGTTSDVTSRPDSLDDGGLFAWRNDAVPVVLRGQSVAADNYARLLLPREALMRVNPAVPAHVLSLDGLTPDDLRGRAEYISRHVSREFLERFGGHRASEYTPLVK